MPTEVDTAGDAELTVNVKSATGPTYGTATPKALKSVFGVGTKWEAGKRYKYNLVVAENQVRIDLLMIEDWDEVNGGNVIATGN